MLSPDTRSLYTAALTPPSGVSLDQAIATTFSLDPTALLTVPVHLALLHRERDAAMDGVTLLEALRQITERTTVYVHRGRVQVPSATHMLYGLLESMVVEARAPNGGAFHPKIWVLRFINDSSEPLLRLLILSRNLTADRCWDLLLQLEGRPSGGYVAANRELGELIRDLPGMAVREVTKARRAQAEELGDEIRRTRWDLPDGYESVAFHVLGRRKGVWMPPRSSEMAVISPFVTAPALEALRKTTGRLVAVLSRPEELDALSTETRSLSEGWWSLDEAAETEGGDAAEARDTAGLHAKAIILRCGWDTKLFLGSANATSAALLVGNNLEIMAELSGKRSRVKGIDELIGADGLRPVMIAHTPPEVPSAVDADEQAAEAALEGAREALVQADLKVVCEREDDGWALVLTSKEAVVLDGIANLRAWPLTVAEEQAADASGLMKARRAALGRFATASVTGFIAFELVAAAKQKRLRFALNLALDGLPAERDTAILRAVVHNRDGFLRYLLLLLGHIGGDGGLLSRAIASAGAGTGAWKSVGSEGLPLLEELTRAFSRDPERLREVGHVIERLKANADGEEVVPRELIELWSVFEQALKERPARASDRARRTEG